MSEVDLDVKRRGPAPTLSPDQRAEVRERYSKGATEDHLAAVFGVGRSTITRALEGVPKRSRGRKPDRTTLSRVSELRERGMTAVEIATELDIPRSSARYHLRKLAGVSDAK